MNGVMITQHGSVAQSHMDNGGQEVNKVFKNLGKSGLKVSPICLGTMTFDREADQDESFRIMDHFIEQGYNFLDTANAYSLGKSEEVVGRWLKKRIRPNLHENEAMAMIEETVKNMAAVHPRNKSITVLSRRLTRIGHKVREAKSELISSNLRLVITKALHF